MANVAAKGTFYKSHFAHNRKQKEKKYKIHLFMKPDICETTVKVLLDPQWSRSRGSESNYSRVKVIISKNKHMELFLIHIAFMLNQ